MTEFMVDRTPTPVIAFLAEITGVRPNRIHSTTRLREDLGMDGDDVDDFVRGVSDRFGVDMKTFEFYRHFHEEPHLAWLLTWWLAARRRGTWRTDPITIADVEAAVRRKAWSTPSATPVI